MLTFEKQQLIERILAHQRELSIPVETKRMRILRMILTSALIVSALSLLKPINSHLPPVLSLLIEVGVGAGVAYLASRGWVYARWVPESLFIPFAGLIFIGMLALNLAVGFLLAPSKPGRTTISWSETFKRMKRGDLTRFKTKGLPTSSESWVIAINDGEDTYRRLTRAEASAYCETIGMRLPANREEILALTPRPQVSRALYVWTNEGRAYQFRGGDDQTLGVSMSGDAETTGFAICLK